MLLVYVVIERWNDADGGYVAEEQAVTGGNTTYGSPERNSTIGEGL